MDTYPILIEGEQAGELTVSREGLMTVFDARCRDTGELLRLAVYGEREGYLGVMVPEDAGGLRLTRRFSRAGLMDLPRDIAYAAPAGMGRAAPPDEEPDEEPESGEEPPGPEETETVWTRGEGEMLWTEADGELLCAVPADTPGIPLERLWQSRQIEGRLYAIFKKSETV